MLVSLKLKQQLLWKERDAHNKRFAAQQAQLLAHSAAIASQLTLTGSYLQGWDDITTLTVKWLVLDDQSELSELMTVVDRSQYACIRL